MPLPSKRREKKIRKAWRRHVHEITGILRPWPVLPIGGTSYVFIADVMCAQLGIGEVFQDSVRVSLGEESHRLVQERLLMQVRQVARAWHPQVDLEVLNGADRRGAHVFRFVFQGDNGPRDYREPGEQTAGLLWPAKDPALP